MKKEDLKQAYEEIPFSDHLEKRVYEKLEKRQDRSFCSRKWKTVMVSLCICMLAVTACTAAAVKYNWFEEIYPGTAKIIEKEVNEPSRSVENEHLRLSVESSAFTGNIANVFVKVETLDQEGREWMRKMGEYESYLSLNLYGEGTPSGGATHTKCLKKYSDEDTWYFQLISMEGKQDNTAPYERAKIFLQTKEDNESTDSEENESYLVLEMEIEEQVDEVKTYTECKDFMELTITPMGVTCIYQRENESKDADIRIRMRNGEELYLSTLLGMGKNKGEYMTTEDNEGRCCIGILTDEFIDLDEIETVTLNGTPVSK